MVVQGLAGGLRPPDPLPGGLRPPGPPVSAQHWVDFLEHFYFFCKTKSAGLCRQTGLGVKHGWLVSIPVNFIERKSQHTAVWRSRIRLTIDKRKLVNNLT